MLELNRLLPQKLFISTPLDEIRQRISILPRKALAIKRVLFI